MDPWGTPWSHLFSQRCRRRWTRTVGRKVFHRVDFHPRSRTRDQSNTAAQLELSVAMQPMHGQLQHKPLVPYANIKKIRHTHTHTHTHIWLLAYSLVCVPALLTPEKTFLIAASLMVRIYPIGGTTHCEKCFQDFSPELNYSKRGCGSIHIVADTAVLTTEKLALP